MKGIAAAVVVVLALAGCTVEVGGGPEEPAADTKSQSASASPSEELDFATWAATEGTDTYVPFAQEFASLARGLVKSANVADVRGVAAACVALGKQGKEGLRLPDSPDAEFNREWDQAMTAYAEAGTYAPLIRAYSTAGINGCAAALRKGTNHVTAATRILNANR